MSNIRLSPRLDAVASLVQPGKRLLDIGTDHAFLPCFLVQQGLCPSAVAADLRVGPLENAKATIADGGLDLRVETLLSDGLDAFPPQTDCAVVFAGMGGLLIAELLERTSWVRDPTVQIVAQPMSHAEDVRRFFFENGFSLDREVCAEDGKHVYCAMAAHFTGGKTTPSPALPYGGLLFGRDDPASARYLQVQYTRLKKRRDALKEAGTDLSEAAWLSEVLKDFERLTACGQCGPV